MSGPPMVKCHYCQTRTRPTRDHIVPVSLGGPGVNWNIVKCCQPCNSRKGNSWPTCRCSQCLRAARKLDKLKPTNAKRTA
jgi:5-methylcytosine-specific restriction endonuclease McrA